MHDGASIRNPSPMTRRSFVRLCLLPLALVTIAFFFC
jgi:hypothetical protein